VAAQLCLVALGIWFWYPTYWIWIIDSCKTPKRKQVIGELNKAFESRVRLGIMSILLVNDSVDFNTLKEMLQVTDGNIASHITALEKFKYIEIRKQFIGKKPNTSYSVTKSGKKAFADHLDALEKLIKSTN
jgi:DNA-binding MarR family transcriptional regulator